MSGDCIFNGMESQEEGPMTDDKARDGLIQQVWDLTLDMDEVYDDDTQMLVNVPAMCAKVVDAGWRPCANPDHDCGSESRRVPSGDVVEQPTLREVADACRAFLTVWNDTHSEPAHFGPAYARLSGLLASPGEVGQR